MHKTKTAWKVVSDPYAPEAQWAPACAEPIIDEDPWHAFQIHRQRADQSTGQKIAEATLLSLLIALLGGAFAGQCVHLTYYAQHLFGQFFFSEYSFETWGPFYYWYNQANALCTYIPLFFAYSMGFWSSIHGFGRKCFLATFGLTTLYSVVVYLLHLSFPFVQEKELYTTLLLGLGVVGSAIAFFLGKTIAKNVAATISPRLIFFAILCTFLPVLASLPVFMSNFAVVAAVSILAALFLGFLIRWTHAGSLKSSILLSLTAASPLVLCGLMHVPVAGWFENLAAPTYGVLAVFTRDLFYYLFLPGAALALPVIGTVTGHWIRYSRGHDRLPDHTMNHHANSGDFYSLLEKQSTEAM